MTKLKKLLPQKLINILKHIFEKVSLIRDNYDIYLKNTNICVYKKRDRIGKLQYKKDIPLKDEITIIQDFYYRMYKEYLDLENPKTYNEKINWLKLYYRNPLITQCCDKYKVREYIQKKVGKQYLVPLINVWYNVDDIDFDSLPQQFALKVNWGSGQNIIVTDKSTLDIVHTKKLLKLWMRPIINHYHRWMEWGYKDIIPAIIAEEFLPIQANETLYDYKFICHKGNISLILLITKRNIKGTYYSFYNINWNKVDAYYDNTIYSLILDEEISQKPENFELMIDIAKKLSEDFPNVRVDLYNINGQIYVGELTFYAGAGTKKFFPEHWNLDLGAQIQLPEKWRSDI